MNRRLLLAGLLSMCGLFGSAFQAPARAAHWYVAIDGSDSGDGSEEHPWQHIQFAVDAVVGTPQEQQFIHIGPGTYFEIVLLQAANSYVSLIGAGADVTMIDASNSGRPLRLIEVTGGEVAGLTLQHGNFFSPGSSSAAFVVTGVNTTASHCVVRSNQGLYQAGIFVTGTCEVHDCEVYDNDVPNMNGNCPGIYVTYPDGAYVYRNYIHDNQCHGSGGAGGMMFFFTRATMEANIIENNYCENGAGAVELKYGYPTFRGNIIRGNNSDGDLTVFFNETQPVFDNNLIVDNNGANAIVVSGGFLASEARSFALNTIVNGENGMYIHDCPAPDQQAQVLNSIVWASGAALTLTNADVALSYSCLSDQAYSGTGVIYANPLFIDPTGGNYHLGAGSPAIDAGDPASDFCNEPWPNGCRVNLGAYGNTLDAESSTVLTCTPTCPPVVTATPLPTATPESTEPPATPTAAGTGNPSATPSPIDTASPTAASSGTTTETPAASRTVTATPTPTIISALILNQNVFAIGDEFLLYYHVYNSRYYFNALLWVVLEVEGVYFFYPGWTETLDYLPVVITPGETNYGILYFVWPDTGSDSLCGLTMYATLTGPDVAQIELLCGIDAVIFGYGDCTPPPSPTPVGTATPSDSTPLPTATTPGQTPTLPPTPTFEASTPPTPTESAGR